MSTAETNLAGGLTNSPPWSGHRVRQVVMPIVHLSGDLREGEVYPGLRLEVLKQSVRQECMGDVPAWTDHWDLVEAEFVLVARKGETLDEDLFNGCGNLFHPFVAALRVVSKAEPGVRQRYLLQDHANPSAGWTRMQHPQDDVDPLGGVAEMTNEQLGRASLLAVELAEASSKNRNLAFALERFGLSYTRTHPADGILDVVIAFEALLSPDGPGEIGYKMGARIRRLLCDSSARALDMMRALYKLRSQVVHEGFHGAIHEAPAMKSLAKIIELPISQPGRLPEATRQAARGLLIDTLCAYLKHPARADAKRVVAALDEMC